MKVNIGKSDPLPLFKTVTSYVRIKEYKNGKDVKFFSFVFYVNYIIIIFFLFFFVKLKRLLLCNVAKLNGTNVNVFVFLSGSKRIFVGEN